MGASALPREPGRRWLWRAVRTSRAGGSAGTLPRWLLPPAALALTAADPLLVARRHVDFLRIGSALCLPRPLTTARHS
jgi:hypothetical protein